MNKVGVLNNKYKIMKKVILSGAILVLSFVMINDVYSLPEQAEGVRGRERAIERIEETIRKFEGVDNFNARGLRRALESIIETTEDKSFCYEFTKSLEYGDEGEEVEKLQEALEIEGSFDSIPDGIYGWDLARAVYDFQNEEALNLTGVAGFGFILGEEAINLLNDKFQCDNNEEDNKTEGEILGVITDCGSNADCDWVSTNCCPENAGAKWECVNKSETKIKCLENRACPQVISPKPTSSCSCIDGICEGKDNRSGMLR